MKVENYILMIKNNWKCSHWCVVDNCKTITKQYWVFLFFVNTHTQYKFNNGISDFILVFDQSICVDWRTSIKNKVCFSCFYWIKNTNDFIQNEDLLYSTQHSKALRYSICFCFCCEKLPIVTFVLHVSRKTSVVNDRNTKFSLANLAIGSTKLIYICVSIQQLQQQTKRKNYWDYREWHNIMMSNTRENTFPQKNMPVYAMVKVYIQTVCASDYSDHTAGVGSLTQKQNRLALYVASQL